MAEMTPVQEKLLEIYPADTPMNITVSGWADYCFENKGSEYSDTFETEVGCWDDEAWELDSLCDAQLEGKHGVLDMSEASIEKLVIEIGEDVFERDYPDEDGPTTDDISSFVDEILMEEL